jgi:hypothetical protein
MISCQLVQNLHQQKNEKYIIFQRIPSQISSFFQRRGNDLITGRLPAVDEEADNDGAGSSAITPTYNLRSRTKRMPKRKNMCHQNLFTKYFNNSFSEGN